MANYSVRHNTPLEVSAFTHDQETKRILGGIESNTLGVLPAVDAVKSLIGEIREDIALIQSIINETADASREEFLETRTQLSRLVTDIELDQEVKHGSLKEMVLSELKSVKENQAEQRSALSDMIISVMNEQRSAYLIAESIKRAAIGNGMQIEKTLSTVEKSLNEIRNFFLKGMLITALTVITAAWVIKCL